MGTPWTISRDASNAIMRAIRIPHWPASGDLFARLPAALGETARLDGPEQAHGIERGEGAVRQQFLGRCQDLTVIGDGGFPELPALERPADTAELDHGRHGRVELVVGAGGDLARVAGLEVPEKPLSRPELVGFEGSPRSLAIQRDPCVESATRLPDVKSGVVVASHCVGSCFIWL